MQEIGTQSVTIKSGSRGVMTLSIVKWILPTFGLNLAPKMYKMAAATYSLTQLYAALAGTALACVIWPIVRLGIKRNR